jgi:hypothetical protein
VCVCVCVVCVVVSGVCDVHIWFSQLKETSSRKRTPTLRALGTLLLGDTKASTKSSNNNKEEPLPSGSFYSPARGKRVEGKRHPEWVERQCWSETNTFLS